MQHDTDGEVGAIDPGDLILVQDASRRQRIITYAEGTEVGGPAEGYDQFGRAGDVVIYRKNGGDGTPIIHRALLEVTANATTSPDRTGSVACPAGTVHDPETRDAGDGRLGTCIVTWNAPGTDQQGVASINHRFPGIVCAVGHGDVAVLEIANWTPSHPGFITLGDFNGCNVDQKEVGPSSPFIIGLRDQEGRPVQVVRSDWIVGIAGGEVPWFGALKLKASEVYEPGSGPGATQVSTQTWRSIMVAVVALLAIPAVMEPAISRLLRDAPEVAVGEAENAAVDEARADAKSDQRGM